MVRAKDPQERQVAYFEETQMEKAVRIAREAPPMDKEEIKNEPTTENGWGDVQCMSDYQTPEGREIGKEMLKAVHDIAGEEENEFRGKVRAVADFVRRITKHKHTQAMEVHEWTAWQEEEGRDRKRPTVPKGAPNPFCRQELDQKTVAETLATLPQNEAREVMIRLKVLCDSLALSRSTRIGASA